MPKTLTGRVAVLSRETLSSEALIFLAQEHLGKGVQVGAIRGAHVGQGAIALLDLDGNFDLATPQLVRQLSQQGAKVVVISAQPEDPRVTATYYAGADALYDLRRGTSGLWELVAELLLSKDSGRSIWGAQWAQALDANVAELTDREHQVMVLIAEDPHRPTPEIAEHLGVSVNTVRTHLANIRNKLGGVAASNTVALVTAVRDRGWIE